MAVVLVLGGFTVWGPSEIGESVEARSPKATESRDATAQRGDGTGGVALRRVGDFDSPTYVAPAPGYPNLLFVVERGGRIVVLRDGERAGVFLDITGQVSTEDERGLLSLAFDPRYRRNRRFYVYYTDRKGDIVVDHFRRSPKSPVRALRSSRKKVIRIRHRDTDEHNGGTLAFGPDRMLYLATGDGGNPGDPKENAQNRRSLLGKLLRIDPRPRTGGYRVPKGNPVWDPTGRSEIFAVGLRNPFRFSFDPGKRTIAIGDVGQARFEEIDYLRLSQARGANFGWDAFEGHTRYDAPEDNEASLSAEEHDPPMLDYRHEGGACAVTGGVTVRDRSLNSLWGRYLYADFCTGELRSFKPRLRRNRTRDDRALGVRVPSPVAFVEGHNHHVYVVSLDRFGGGSGEDAVFRLVPAS